MNLFQPNFRGQQIENLIAGGSRAGLLRSRFETTKHPSAINSNQSTESALGPVYSTVVILVQGRPARKGFLHGERYLLGMIELTKSAPNLKRLQFMQLPGNTCHFDKPPCGINTFFLYLLPSVFVKNKKNTSTQSSDAPQAVLGRKTRRSSRNIGGGASGQTPTAETSWSVQPKRRKGFPIGRTLWSG